MKKLLLAIAMVATGFTANAQETTFGVKAGLNISNISGEDVENNDARTSFHIGAVVEFGISDKFSIQPELLYSAQGVKTEVGLVDITNKLDYLTLPVMAKYYVAEGFSLEAGPQLGIMISAKSKVEASGQSTEVDVRDNFNGIDFGLNFGAGYKLKNGLNFGARYNLGLSDIKNEEELNVNSNSVKNGVFQISVGYNF